MKKIKKILIALGINLAIFWNKVLAVEPMYGIPSPSVYGIPSPGSKIKSILSCINVIFLPIVFLIGSIVYFKKSKRTKKVKIAIILISVIVIYAIMCGISRLIDYMFY